MMCANQCTLASWSGLPANPYKLCFPRSPACQVSTELVQLARVQPAPVRPEPSGTNRRPTVVDPGSFLSLLLPSIGTHVGSTVLDELWAGKWAARHAEQPDVRGVKRPQPPMCCGVVVDAMVACSGTQGAVLFAQATRQQVSSWQVRHAVVAVPEHCIMHAA